MTDLEEDAVVKHEEVDDLWHAVSDLQDMKATLAEDIGTNASDILALTTRVETNEGDIETLNENVGTNTDNISTLMTTTGNNTSDISTLFDFFADLEGSVNDLIAAGLIEDYFFVNAEDTELFPRNSDMEVLVEPFCITEPGVFIFNLAVNYASTDDNT